jgi:hypothetical protein
MASESGQANAALEVTGNGHTYPKGYMYGAETGIVYRDIFRTTQYGQPPDRYDGSTQ